MSIMKSTIQTQSTRAINQTEFHDALLRQRSPVDGGIVRVHHRAVGLILFERVALNRLASFSANLIPQFRIRTFHDPHCHHRRRRRF